MKKIIIILLIVIFAATSQINAQTTDNQPSGFLIDGLRLSQNFYGSTARTAAMGSAFSSLGGDLGSISINPAGLGVYRSSEFSFSPGLNAISTNSLFNGEESTDMLNKFGLGNMGLVLNFKTNSDMKSATFAIGYNKLNSLNRSYMISGNNYSTANPRYTSQTDEFLSYANNTYPEDLDPYWERLAFDAFAIDTADNTYFSPFTDLALNQRHEYSIKGSSGEFYFGFGANFNDMLYFGGSLNIYNAYYEDNYDHTEIDANAVSYMRYYTFSRFITTSATGANFKLGMIFKPTNELRFSLALHTPTVMKVRQEADSRISSVLSDGDRIDLSPSDQNNNRIPPEEFDFSFSSPLRGIAGVALVSSVGLLSFDYEYADYSTMHFSNGGTADDTYQANQDKKAALQQTHNFRVGGELKLGNAYLRGGYALYGSPYKSKEINKNLSTSIFSTGLGYRNNNFSIDFSYSLQYSKEKYFMYSTAVPADLKTYAGNFMTTLGFRF